MRRNRVTVTVVLEGDCQTGTAHRRARDLEDRIVEAAGYDYAPLKLMRVDSDVTPLRPTSDGWEPA